MRALTQRVCLLFVLLYGAVSVNAETAVVAVAANFHPTASRLAELGLVDEVIAEPLGGAHRNANDMALRLGQALRQHLAAIETQDLDTLCANRYERLMGLGHVRE